MDCATESHHKQKIYLQNLEIMKVRLLILLFLLISHLSFSQRTVTGMVRADSGEPLPGVTITIKGTTKGTTSDIDGKYSLTVESSEGILVFTYVGFMSKEETVGNRTVIDVTLEESHALEEVVVTGYSGVSRSKKSAGYSIKARGISSMGKSKHIAKTSSKSDTKIVSSGETSAKSGMLTAGELHDFSKWNLWEKIAKNDLKTWQEHWQINPLGRYMVQLVTESGFPVIDSPIELLDTKGKVIWQTRTDNTGKAELWSGIFEDSSKMVSVGEIRTEIAGKMEKVKSPNTFHNGVNLLTVDAECEKSNKIDIAFVVDATGSMGDEIRYLQAELSNVIQAVKDSLPKSELNLASVFYRDETDSYLTVKSEFSTNSNQTTDFIQKQSADGGGDFPEAVDDGLDVAINQLQWSKKADARLLFLVLDAPPHHNDEKIRRIKGLMKEAAKKGIRIIPVAASGIDKSTEYLMRCMALATNGTYVFLTDDSGIGGKHIKPTTDEYKVELLNDLLLRLIFAYTKVESCETEKPKDETVLSTKKEEEDEKEEVEKVKGEMKWSCFPNPTSGVFKVEMAKKIKEFFVTDLTGKILIRHEPKDKSEKVDLSAYPSGIYFVRFVYEEKNHTKKVVLRR